LLSKPGEKGNRDNIKGLRGALEVMLTVTNWFGETPNRGESPSQGQLVRRCESHSSLTLHILGS